MAPSVCGRLKTVHNYIENCVTKDAMLTENYLL